MITRFFGLLTIALFVVACSSSSESDSDAAKNNNNPEDDGGTNNNNVKFDKGVEDDATVEDDTAVVVPDKGTDPDTAPPPADLTCPEIMTCLTTCQQTDTACQTACVESGVPAEAAKFVAMGQCMQPAGTGACATDCANPQSADCNACIIEQCTDSINACVGGTGTPIDGFGESCDVAAPSCKAGLICAGPMQGGDPAKGFCSAECPAPGLPCADAPDGTSTLCGLQTPTGQIMCMFLCEMGNRTYTCPGGMVCGAENQGLKPCQPPPAQ